MNRFVLVSFFLINAIVAFAQGSLKVKVIDRQSNTALQFVSVRVNDATTGKLVRGGTTDISGACTVEGLPYGKYVAVCTFMGYKEVSRSFELTAGHKQASFPAIYMSEDNKMLQEVKVTGQRSQMKLEVDRKTFTVDEVLAAAGGTASELLENIPSIEVTTDGEISLRGSTSVEVWINGKASGLTADNRGEILQQIPAESIERVEVIDNPSAKYSPEGSAGIINIILKRDRKAGYYGSTRIGADSRGGWNASGNISYSSGPLEAYANLGYRQRKNSRNGYSETLYPTSDQYQRYENEGDNGGHNLFARAGLTWRATEKDEFSVSGMTMRGKHDNENLTPYHYGVLSTNQDTRIMSRLNSSNGNMLAYNIEAEYTHTFAEGHLIKAYWGYNNWNNDGDTYYRDSTQWMDGRPSTYTYQERPMDMKSNETEIYLDYENKISDKLKIEAGYQGNYSRENSLQMSWIDNGSWNGTNKVEDKDYFNRFIYDTEVHAFYATANAKLGKFGVMAGLRGEYWKVNTESYSYEQEYDPTLRFKPFKKDYFDLFPSLFLNYELSESSQIQLNYSRRLRRPWGGQLNNFKDTRDASMVSFGNPELTPEFTNAFSLNYLKTWTNHTLSIGAYYRPTTDIIERVAYMQNDTLYSTSENVAKSQAAGTEVILKNKLFRFLDLTTTVYAYYYKLDGFSYVINDQTVTGNSDENFSWEARMLAAVILPYDISLQTTVNYRSRSVISQGHREPNFSLNLGLRKTFFNKALALAINCRNVLSTQRHETFTSTDTFERHQKNWRDPRVNVSLSWNFGNMGASKKKQKHGDDDFNMGGEDGGGFGGYEQ